MQRSDYDGARPVTLLQSREPIVSPRFSPDGRRIAYVSFEQKRPRIFIQYVDTGRREQITNFEGLNGAPAFSLTATAWPSSCRATATRKSTSWTLAAAPCAA